ncbi:hypothetical protein CyaNS01_01416 [Cyanobium sp. NS01]|nr:hypothetical protein CyaNS01_01416 [Cyanobium sp. NS01]
MTRLGSIGLSALAITVLAGTRAAAQAPPEGTGATQKESFMLMFGKGNGAMRTLCALERDGLITATQRQRYSEQLMAVLTESADGATAHRNVRIGMAFADGRSSLCPSAVFSPGPLSP